MAKKSPPARGKTTKPPAMPPLLPPAARSLAETARKLLRPTDRQPYWLGSQPIGNLDELVANLEKFTGEHSVWVADWIEYLGDAETAARIRTRREEFKEILRRRQQELKQWLGQG